MTAATTVPPFYVISQDDEPWKMPIALAHLADHGITPKVIHGVNGHLIALRPVNPHEVLRTGAYDYMHPSQVGCVIAHLTALTCACADDVPEFIVAEDDVVLVDGFVDRWAKARYDLGAADVAQLEHLSAEAYHGTPLNDYWAECHYPFGAACIWWRRETALAALRMLRPIDSPYDIMLVRRVYPFVRHVIAWPAMASQRTATGGWSSSVSNKPKEGAGPEAPP